MSVPTEDWELARWIGFALHQAATAGGIPADRQSYLSLDSYLDAILQAANETTAVTPDQYHLAYRLRSPGNPAIRLQHT